MATAKFRFAADILRRLGEELNPNIDQGVIELVKNAYDADATKCEIEFVDTDWAGGTIRVSDSGDGMDASSIATGWLVLGRSTKTTNSPTRLGRVPAGNKGLGRLAALRLGHIAELTTRPLDEPGSQYHLSIDWRRYEQVELVEDVPLEIRRDPRPTGESVGTTILLRKLRQPVREAEVKRLARALVLLADPFGDDPSGFQPVLLAPSFQELEALVRQRYFEDADYHLTAEVDKNGRASAIVTDHSGKILFEASHDELAARHPKAPYACPEATFDLWSFILTKASFELRSSTLTEVKAWLKEFGGVHLYQNRLRVSPYGNQGNDWLDMNLRRVRSPEERPSTNNSIGRVAVHDTSALLVQKTDRSGFIETEAFSELRLFAQDALDWMARRRMEMAEAKRQAERAKGPKRTNRAKKVVEEAIAHVTPTDRAALQQAFEAYDRSREKEVRGLQREVQLYRTLSTAGITAATFAHESSGNPLKVINGAIRTIERRGKKELRQNYETLFAEPVSAVHHAAESLAVLGSATLSLIHHDKRRQRRVDVHAVIEGVLKTFQPFLLGRDVAVNVDLVRGNPFLRATEAAIESVITNLLNNSLNAFEQADADVRMLQIRTELADRMLVLRVADNGPGIEGIELRSIWLPGETTRANGTGLGLTIVRDTVRDLGGHVDAIAHGELGGAEFTLELPILGI